MHNSTRSKESAGLEENKSVTVVSGPLHSSLALNSSRQFMRIWPGILVEMYEAGRGALCRRKQTDRGKRIKNEDKGKEEPLN